VTAATQGRDKHVKLRFTTVARLNGEERVLEWLGEVAEDPFNGPFVLQRQ